MYSTKKYLIKHKKATPLGVALVCFILQEITN